uniref:Membrane-associated guanylate kinase, WW and PDZ domain-containing protein 2-like n=1 Tax=Sinocyclocheilus rhinocerous TaxID=307959 RepID=A0A673GFM8_9TELE
NCLYFTANSIHNTKTTSWLDPRLAKKAKPPEECKENELPYGWEKIDDPVYGTYYVDHINRRTQFENPVLEAKRRLQQQQQMQSQGLSSLPLPSFREKKPLFTRDPTQLKGSFLSTALQKSNMGFGFTIIGGDEPDEFLQVKSVIPDGPAAQDGKMATGDVIVYINDVCVLGTTHSDVVKLFQSVPIGQSVTLVLCRGYPLPYDPEDAASTLLSPLSLIDRPLLVNGRNSYDSYMEYISRTARFVDPIQTMLVHPHPGDTHLDAGLLEDSVSVASSGAAGGELLTVTMVKGADGFGFTIADSNGGQRVKQILEAQGCPGLCEGDLIVEINQQTALTLSHTQVVELLKECPVGAEATLVVQRGRAGKETFECFWVLCVFYGYGKASYLVD